MAGTVVIKWGGGLITHKDKLCTVNLDVIQSLAEVCSNSSKQLVIVHGAGSFGHMKAKKFRLSEGRIEGLDQDDAVKEVRTDMLELNSIIVNQLRSKGLDVQSFPPHQWAEGVGPNFSGKLPLHTGVTVVYGDVVNHAVNEFGILSGDDLMVRYASEIPDVERAVFAIKGVDGILKLPPSEAGPGDLIEVWSPGMEFKGEHQTEIDVTGGIGLKATRGAMIAENGIDVVLINGENYQRVLDAIEGHSVIGTKIVAGNC